MKALKGKMRLKTLSVLVACVSSLVMALGMTGVARAEEHDFCWGAKVGFCESGTWYMHAAYANSSQGAICVRMLGELINAGCDSKPNEGIYISWAQYYWAKAAIYNNNPGTIIGYGVFWT